MDRVIEVDADSFGTPPTRDGIRRFLDRVAPLWEACGPDDVRGVVLNLGWVMDIVTEWSGDPEQLLPIRSRRMAGWAELRYADLAAFLEMLVDEAERAGVGPVRVGPMFIGVGEFATEIVRAPDPDEDVASAALYAERSGWYERHPEAFPKPIAVTLHGPGIDPGARLHADTHRYATRPDGLREGESFAAFLGDQWRSLTEVVGFTLIHLRDEFTTPMHAGRMDHDGGTTPASAAQITAWTDGVIDLVRAVKQARPEALVLLYSSGLAPTAEWRFGRLDTHRLVAAGDVDVWIEQTWGGAWQDWWDAGWAGWTFQLAYLLQRGAVIADANRERATPCKRYKLVQALDGWEPYDTFHDYPGKLRWGIWAFSHAAALADGRAIVPDGSYVAVLNDRTRTLMDERDVRWLATELDAAEASAAALERIHGPVVVHDRASVQRLVDDHTDQHAGEWIEEQLGFLLKWGLPVLAATTADRLAALDVDGVVLQVPVAADPERDATVAAVPALVVGRADLLSTPIARLAGVTPADRQIEPGYALVHTASPDLRPRGWISMPPHVVVDLADDVEVLQRTDDTALLTRRGTLLAWQPPDWANPANRQLPHYQIGGVEPHIEAVRALQTSLRAAGHLGVDPLPVHGPACVHAWRSGGVLHLLFGNVESGWIGDSRHPRAVVVHVPDALIVDRTDPVLVTVPDGEVLDPTPATPGQAHHTFEVRVPPEGCVVARLERRPPAQDPTTRSTP
ncbi:MAG: hypothetical protein JJT89_02760 [Nitriliruptoraceae bacterium]|nr:hypothetical protein [Nitriliruptoraceae bacterium]